MPDLIKFNQFLYILYRYSRNQTAECERSHAIPTTSFQEWSCCAKVWTQILPFLVVFSCYLFVNLDC